MRTTVVVCVALFGLLAMACSSSNASEAVDPAALQPIVDAWAEANDMSVLAVSVRSPSGSVTSVGYSAEGDTPDDRSLFITGSLGKTMMAATTLLLVEDGVLDLDEPIERWLPEFPRANEITLRQLLSHTAGLTDRRPESDLDPGPESLERYEEGRTPAELLAEAANVVSEASLPAQHSYSTASFWAAGAVIESATGESLADVMQVRVFEPLGMDDSHLDWPGAIDQALVEGELTLPSGEVIPLGTEIIPDIMSAGWGPGGVLSSARDVAVFYGALFDDLLAPESVEAMTSTTPESESYGLGIGTRRWAADTAGWGHGGATLGYSSEAGVTDDGWTVAVLTNHFDLASGGQMPDPNGLVGEVLRHVGGETRSSDAAE